MKKICLFLFTFIFTYFLLSFSFIKVTNAKSYYDQETNSLHIERISDCNITTNVEELEEAMHSSVDNIPEFTPYNVYPILFKANTENHTQDYFEEFNTVDKFYGYYIFDSADSFTFDDTLKVYYGDELLTIQSGMFHHGYSYDLTQQTI